MHADRVFVVGELFANRQKFVFDLRESSDDFGIKVTVETFEDDRTGEMMRSGVFVSSLACQSIVDIGEEATSKAKFAGTVANRHASSIINRNLTHHQRR